ncbi:hypothetical protein K461DRAFT_319862 [Myriangium duriaei CBS 260.36]|uniref:L-tryptophan decarboxylase PsiD-like domain-containing protein n=1 Tax=Myriangium duriaei CBS 260.36 TaxID=1168546 RepID=A0A9P4J5H8_9PEZI|nr:hypothetical protein K461DRAFT_319862 [Myriangium duriaei CBS 260.36]
MASRTTAITHDHYRGTFGWLAGYLPEDLGSLNHWLNNLQAKAAAGFKDTVGYEHKAVKELSDLIADNGVVRMYLTRSIDEAKACGAVNIENIADMLRQLDLICKLAPVYNKDKNNRVFFPMSALFVHVMAMPTGKSLFRDSAFNGGLRRILETWAQYLDSTGSLSVLNKDPKTGWLGTDAIKEFELELFEINWNEEHGGFRSYNDFFHREIYPRNRPVCDPNDSRIIVSANDGTVYRIDQDVQAFDAFWIKEKRYSLSYMLNNPDPKTLEKFIGGTVVQVFLSGADYHRWHAPVDGVVHYKYVKGLLFSENDDNSYDPDAGVLSQVYGAEVNNRGLAAITANDSRLGTVYVVPIGITEISSLTFTAEDGHAIKKGAELGYFSYGGSTLCLVFEKKVKLDFGELKEKASIKVNAKIARLVTDG